MFTQQQLAEVLRYFRRAVARHWKKGAIVGGVAAAVALVGAMMMPRTYYSEARLFVRFGRENQVDLTAAGGQMVSLYESRESEINSLIEILKSRAILDRVVNELGPQYILAGRPKPKSSGPEPAAADVATTRPHQQAVRELEKSLLISAPRKSNIITVGCKAKKPEIAQQIVARLVAVYLEEHVRVHRTPGSFEFFAEQAKISQSAWRAAADKLREAKNRMNIVTIDGRRKELESLQTQTATALLANETDQKSSAGLIDGLKRQIESLPETIVTQEVAAPSASFDGMRQTLFGLEAQEHELSAKMHDRHPKLAAVRQQVADLRAILAAQPVERMSATAALHPARQQLEQRLLQEQSSALAMQAKERALLGQQQEQRAELAALNAGELELNQLQQQVALAEANHKDYAQRLEQARINRSLDDERISSLSLVQPASFVAAPGGPRRTHVLAAGLLLAVASAVGTILLAAWLNPVVTTAEQLAVLWDLPLVSTIPPRAKLAA